jgi:hypothetical protein
MHSLLVRVEGALFVKIIVLSGLLLAGTLQAQWNASNQGIALGTLGDAGIAKSLSSQLRAGGNPLFLVGDPSRGLQKGDIIRFRDKAVLIDDQVWQMLRNEGAIPALKIAPLPQAKPAPSAPAKLSPRERRAIELGDQVLAVLQKNASLPAGKKLVLTVVNGEIVAAPAPAPVVAAVPAPAPIVVVAPAPVKAPALANQAPILAGTPPQIMPGNPWTFQPVIRSRDHAYSALRLTLGNRPEGLTLDTAQGLFRWVAPINLPTAGMSLGLCAKDPVGDSTCMEWPLVAKAADTKANQPPRFVSRLEDSLLTYEQGARYRPIAIDPEGDVVSLRVKLPEGSPLRWNGTHLTLPSGAAGTHHAEIVAIDEHDQQSSQTIHWSVAPSHDRTFFEARHENGIGLWSVGTNLGKARLGLFTPSVSRLFGWSDRENMQLPYVFLGLNLINTAESQLALDAGFTLRSPAPQFFTGGAMARLQGSRLWQGSSKWKSDFDLTAWIDQAVQVSDTSGTRLVTQPPVSGSNPAWNLNQVQSYRTSWLPAVRKVLADQNRQDNAVLIARVDALREIKQWLWTGPMLELDTRPFRNELDPILGWSAQIDYQVGKVHLKPTARLGWGLENGFGLFASLLLER